MLVTNSSFFFLITLLFSFALAVTPVQAKPVYSPMMAGPLGLNLVPNARMDPTGTVRTFVSMQDPYIHAGGGMQLAAPLYIGLRQSGQGTDLSGDTDQLFPGMDLKLRLIKETACFPALAVGLQSAWGHKRMAGEYLVFSKRYRNFDFSGGIAWGRLGSAAHIANPLGLISNHFDKKRALDGEMASNIEDWFTGEEIGFFAGVEYFPPIMDGDLSFKLDWGADRYKAEAAAWGFDSPAPWSAGLSYHPKPWLSVGAAIVGGDILTGSLSFQPALQNWPLSGWKEKAPAPMRGWRTGLSLPKEMDRAAKKDGFDLHTYMSVEDSRTVWGRLHLKGNRPAPQALGRAARHMANHAGPAVEAINIIPQNWGLQGPAVRLLRSDLERALGQGQGSPQEIWQNTRFLSPPSAGLDNKSRLKTWRDQFLKQKPLQLALFLEQEISPSEEDAGLLYRTSAVVAGRRQIGNHIVSGGAFRLNIADNLDKISQTRPRFALPVRSNIDQFASQTVGLERLYIGYLKSFGPDWHIGAFSGYLEEMYQGFGGEVLYRPFGKRYGLGAEAWQVFKRSPYTALNLGLNGDHLLTGHLNAWYEIPNSSLTLEAKAGRYLAADIGGTLGLSRNFTHGGQMRSFITATNKADQDPFGGTTHLYGGISFVMPLGSLPLVPGESAMRLTAAPLGRDSGQALDKPMPLYDLTTPLSYSHFVRHWTSVTD